MKINEIEALVGITKKNIRFYEAQGLLSPKRNAENSYRDYSEQEVQTLLRIKLLRKLGVPIEEIRSMLSGTHTVADSMRRHLVSLEREAQNLQHAITLCSQLRELDVPLTELDAEATLSQIAALEQGGTTFQNKQVQDIRVRYIAPVLTASAVVALLIALAACLLWSYRIAPEESPPVWFLWIVIGIFAAVGLGVLLALLQRIQEIGKGEMDDAKKY